MKIQGTGGSQQTTRLEKKKAASSIGNFSAASKASLAQMVPDIAVVSEICPTEALLSLQEALNLSAEDRASVKNGQQILDDLEQVHKGILSGCFSKNSLEGLAHRIRDQRAKTSNPDLETILIEIELRAEVELAKLSYSKIGQTHG